MIGKICMVTGANAGIGKSTALGLGKMGATVVMICRNRERGEAALNEIKQVSGNDNASLLLADLSSQNSIRQLVENFKTQYTALHVLINNAGNIPKKRTITEDGIETQFAVSHLAYFLLTNLLLDVLKASAPSRIINVASTLHQFTTITFDDLQSGHSYKPSQIYNRLLGSDGELHASGDDSTVFFIPRQGAGEDEELENPGDVREIPPSLRRFVAFLSDRVHVYEEKGGRLQQTPTRKRLQDSRLVSRFRREDILNDVLLARTPTLPVAMHAAEAQIRLSLESAEGGA